MWLRRAVAHHGGVVQPGQRAGAVRLGRVDISKVRLALAAVRREQVEPERAIADAQVLGVRDLKERYHRLPIGGLTWADVDSGAGQLRVRRQLDRETRERVEPKTRQAARDVILMPALGRTLTEHRLASPYAADTDFVFASGRGGGLDQTVARAALARALDAAGVASHDKPKLRFHDLRHIFTSMLVAQGANVVFISRQLGHASPDITLKVYAHLFDAAEHAERATAALEHGFAATLDGNNLETASRYGRQPTEKPYPTSHAFLSQPATIRSR